MKKICMLLASVALFACGDDSAVEDSGLDAKIEISAATIEFGYTGEVEEGKNKISVTSSGVWKLIGKEVSWCTPSLTEGGSGSEVTFEVPEVNDSGAEREVVYAFVCGNRSAKLVVKQSSDGMIKPVSYAYYMGNKGGDIVVPIQHDVNFTYEISETAKSWITDITPTRASEMTYLRFNVAATAEYEPRSGAILLKKAGSVNPITIEVTQEFFRDIQIEQLNYTVEPEGGTIAVDVMANTEFTMNIPSAVAKWVSQTEAPASSIASRAAMVGSKIYLKVAETNSSRTGMVSFSIPVKTVQIAIKQKGVNSKPLNEDDVNFAKKLESAGLVTLVDGKYELTEAGLAAKVIDVSNANITSLKGIEQFDGLIRLSCQKNKITSLNPVLSCAKLDYINCSNNDLTTIDVSKLKLLTTVSCGQNPVTVINLGDANLGQISFSSNFQNGSTGVRATTCAISSSKLPVINITAQGTGLDVLDLRGCTALTTVNAYIWTNPVKKIILSSSQRGVRLSINENYTTVEYI